MRRVARVKNAGARWPGPFKTFNNFGFYTSDIKWQISAGIWVAKNAIMWLVYLRSLWPLRKTEEKQGPYKDWKERRLGKRSRQLRWPGW
jgi:hypothetical protein